jgi:hypothetical protein
MNFQGKTQAPQASDSRTGMGQELALVVHPSFTLLDDAVHGDDDDFKLMVREIQPPLNHLISRSSATGTF